MLPMYLIERSQGCIGRPSGRNQRLGLSFFYRQIQEERCIRRVGRPGGRRSKHGFRAEISFFQFRLGFDGLHAVAHSRIHRAVHVGHHAAGTEQVQTGENIGVFLPNPNGAVAAHRVPRQSAAGWLAEWCDTVCRCKPPVLCHKILPVANRDRVGVHAAEIPVVGVGRHNDKLPRFAIGQRFVHYGRQIDPVLGQAIPFIVAVGKSVQKINDRVTPLFVGLVTGRQVNRHVPVGRITRQVALPALCRALSCAQPYRSLAGWSGYIPAWLPTKRLTKTGCELNG